MSFVRGRRFSSRVQISTELSDAPCAVCGEASGVHDWWVYRPDVGQKKSVLQQAREGLLDLSASTIKDPAELLRALRDDTSGSSTGGGAVAGGGGGTAAQKLKSKKEKLKDDDNFLLAQGDDDSDEDEENDDGNGGGAAAVEGASPALSTRGSPAACDGHVTECNECFCAKSIADLLWTDKMDARVLTPPKQINAIMLEKLTTSWAMYMHRSALQIEHVSLADCPGGSFLDIVTHNAEAAAKRKMQKSVAKKNDKEKAKKKKKKNGRSSSSLSSSASSGSEEDLYAGLSDSDCASDLDSDSGSSSDDDDFSMPHIASLQILGFSDASAPAAAASMRRKASASISAAAQSMLSVLASATMRTTGSSASDQTTGIALLFPRLKRLVLRECETLKNPALINVNDCLLLKYLDLSGCSEISSLSALTDLKTLSHLNISCMAGLVVPAAVMHITARMPLLRELVAAGLPELDDDCFVMIMQKLASLTTLDVSGSSVTENALTRAAGTPGTRTLQVLIARETRAPVAAASADAAAASAAASATQSSDVAVSTLAGELEGLLNFSALESLDLQRNSRITAAVTLNVAVCPNIKSLALASTPLTAADMDALSTAKNLLDLSLCWCDVDDECLEALADIALLEKLALDGCVRITPDGLEHLEGLRSLQSLSLYCCTKIEDAAALILRSFPLLHTLNVGRCGGITEAFVAELLAPPRPATASAAAAENASAAEAAKADAGATGNDANNENNNNNNNGGSNAGSGGLQLLRHLNLEGAAITDASVRLVTSSLKFIEVLHMERCNELAAAESVVELIKSRCETLRFLFLNDCEQLAKGKLQISMAAAKVPSMCVRF